MSDLIPLVIRDPRSFEVRYPDDVARLVQVAHDAGYQLSDQLAVYAWEQHSDVYAAGWLRMVRYSDEDLLYVILNYLQPTTDG